MVYRRDIDGLRALAVMPVILFHAGISEFSGGYVGVDVFFVISGYLITSIILAEMQNNSFSLLGFYERRARRILPALFVVALFSFLAGWNWLLPVDMLDLSRSVVATTTFTSNFFFWISGGYFGVANELRPLLHTWSLSVEEQFYLVFPLFLIFMQPFSKLYLLITLTLVATGSLIFSHWLSLSIPTPNFFLIFSRMWELAIGALIAFYLIYQKPEWDRPVSSKYLYELPGISGLLMIFYAVLVFDKDTPFPSFYALIPTLGAALVILFSSPDTIVGRILGSKLLVGIGLISYSAYLWHQPVFAFSRYLSPSPPSFVIYALLILFIFIISYISWRVIEMPFRNRKRFKRKTIFVIAFIGSFFLCAIGLAGHFSHGFDNREFDGVKLTGNNRYGGKSYDFSGNNGLESDKRVILYGDSHALQITPILDSLLTDNGFRFDWLLHSACMSLPGIHNYHPDVKHINSCKSQLDTLVSKASKGIEFLILAYRYDKTFVIDGEVAGRISESREIEKRLVNSIDRLVETLPDRARLILIGNVPTTNLLKEGGYIRCKIKVWSPECHSKFPETEGELYTFNLALKRYANKRSDRVIFINPYDSLCFNGACIVRDDKKLYYSDHAHLSIWGSILVAESVLAKITN